MSRHILSGALVISLQCVLSAATVRMQFSGAVESTDIDSSFNPAPFRSGDRWVVTLEYPHPVAPTVSYDQFGKTWQFFGSASLIVTVGGLTWTAPGFTLSTTDFYLPDEGIVMGGGVLSPISPASDPYDGFHSSYRAPPPFVYQDVSSLPASLAQWDLTQATEFSFLLYSQTFPTHWEARSSHFDSVTIGVVPEPATVALLAVGPLAAMVGRRRKSGMLGEEESEKPLALRGDATGCGRPTDG